MDGTMLKLLFGGVIAAHGVGHCLGWMPAFGLARFDGVSNRSWLLSGVMGDGARLVAGAAFLVPMFGFLVAGVGLATGQPWWRPVAAGSAAVSLACTVVFPQAFTLGSTAGSVAVNLIVLYGILIAGWGQSQAS